MQLRDALGTIYTDEGFADLFPTHGQPALAPWRLALVTVFQCMEGLTDRQAADAVRDRLAWKYALSLEWTDPGFDQTVLSEFRSRLVEGNAEQRLLDLLLERCREGGWLKAHGRQRTDSTHVLARIRALNRTLCVAQTMVYVLNVLSEVAPDWVRTHVPVEWVERYGERLEHERLLKARKKSASSTPIKWEPMADLAEKELLPDQHLVDAGYVTSANLVKTQSDYGVDEGPSHPQNPLVSSGDRLRPHALRHRLGSADRDLSTGPEQFELDIRPGCRQIADQGEVFSKRL
jgi:transposase